MRLWGVRRGSGLFCTRPEFIEQFDTLPWEKQLRYDVTQPRNSAFSAVFHMLCHRIGQGIGEPLETIKDWLKIETGHYILVSPSTRSRFAKQDELADRLRAEAIRTEDANAAIVMREAAFQIDKLNEQLARREKLHLKSVAFDKMDEVAFREFFNRCVVIIYEKWKIDPASVADLLLPENIEALKR